MVTCLATMAYVNMQHVQYVLLFLALAVNSVWFQILQSYMLLALIQATCSYMAYATLKSRIPPTIVSCCGSLG